MASLHVFVGYKTHPKRYKSYLTQLGLCKYDTEEKMEITSESVIITHSLGLVRALIQCNQMQQIPRLIIALDPDSILPADINAKINTLEDKQLVQIYTTYVSLNINPSKFRIIAFRNQRSTLNDVNLFSQMFLYKENTHYPFMVKSVLNQICKLIQSAEQSSQKERLELEK